MMPPVTAAQRTPVTIKSALRNTKTVITNNVEEKNDIRPHRTVMPRSAPTAVLPRGDNGWLKDRYLFIPTACIVFSFVRNITASKFPYRSNYNASWDKRHGTVEGTATRL